MRPSFLCPQDPVCSQPSSPLAQLQTRLYTSLIVATLLPAPPLPAEPPAHQLPGHLKTQLPNALSRGSHGADPSSHSTTAWSRVTCHTSGPSSVTTRPRFSKTPRKILLLLHCLLLCPWWLSSALAWNLSRGLALFFVQPSVCAQAARHPPQKPTKGVSLIT